MNVAGDLVILVYEATQNDQKMEFCHLLFFVRTICSDGSGACCRIGKGARDQHSE